MPRRMYQVLDIKRGMKGWTVLVQVVEKAYPQLSQDIKGVVVHAFPPREQGLDSSKTRDFVIVNEEKIPMLLTLWNEFEEHDGTNIANIIATAPLIIAMRVKVTTFGSLSLTTRMTSCLLLNPPLPEEMLLKDWYNANKEDLKYLVDVKAYRDPTRLLPPPKQEDIIDIGTALRRLQDVKTAWVKAKTQLILGQQRYWYTACANCYKSVHAEIDWQIKCPSCKEETEVEVRCRIGIMLRDSTGTLNAATMIGQQLAASIQICNIVAFVRCYDRDFQGQTNRRHNIVKAYTCEEMIRFTAAMSDEEMPLLAADISNSKSTPEKDSHEEHQLFTPSTKKILNEIANASVQLCRPTSSSAGVKRNLFLAEGITKAEPSTKMNTAEQTDEAHNKDLAADVHTGESPSKKNRDKLKLS